MLAHWFHFGGPVMFAIAACIPACLALVVLYAAMARPALRNACAAMIAIALGLGAYGWWRTEQVVDAALAGMPPPQAAELRVEGDAEAAVPLKFGAGLAALTALGLAAGMLRARARARV